MIRAYVPWYLVRNYLVFAFIACLATLQLAEARKRRERIALPFAVLVAAFLVFYALAPELLTPGPAGGELTFLFGGTALVAVWISDFAPSVQIAARLLHRKLEPRKENPIPRAAALSDSHVLRFGIWHLIFPLASIAIFLTDVPLFHVLNKLALRTPLIDVPVQFLMNDYIVPTALVLALLALWFAGRDADEQAEFQRMVLRALLAMALASIVLKLVNQAYFRARPFAFDDSVRLLFYHPSDSTMPSNAATVCFSLAVAVWLRQRRWGTVMLALGTGMILARVVGGVHYPADVVAGAWLGSICAWLVNRAAWLDRPLESVIGLARHLRLA